MRVSIGPPHTPYERIARLEAEVDALHEAVRSVNSDLRAQQAQARNDLRQHEELHRAKAGRASAMRLAMLSAGLAVAAIAGNIVQFLVDKYA